ncbi:SDR family NAD(P)-dependent oxidoreductase [Pseudovibrio sp. Tun.PSC04-5.I4]|uniref:SDR family NAD(P)-dependent oxidoreductase n=1 Tax=Pseudovibrio sp. Tun.PSC04-5.I4 TaxID=1798213 RepID=UPI00088E0C63|nr:SDR family NAD(P)-dependent oxidoreductase [Pseudovibrio sp. Tun.PSC04-5.I4]SDR21443.1 short chain dehydrogenase [Pseudovibrio sp. Tun.PSC04-5.I4]
MKKAKAIPVPPPPGYLEEWRETSQTHLITGATDGIGRALAIRLADVGQKLAIVGRSEAKVQAVLKDLHAAGPNQQHIGFTADLSLISEVDRLSKEIIGKLPDLNRVVLCAMALPGFQGLTAEGIESGLAVNYLSRVHLLNKLLPLLKTQPETRVISFASPQTPFAQPDLGALNDPNCQLDTWERRVAHTNCNLLYLAEFFETLKGTSVCMNAFGPGLVLTKQVLHYSFARRFYLGMLSSLVGKSAPYAALPAMHILLSQDFVGKTNGFYECDKKLTVSAQHFSRENREKFWAETRGLLLQSQKKDQ